MGIVSTVSRDMVKQARRHLGVRYPTLTLLAAVQKRWEGGEGTAADSAVPLGSAYARARSPVTYAAWD